MTATDYDRWLRANQEYLTAALAWLRLRLLRRADRHPEAVLVEPVPPDEAPKVSDEEAAAAAAAVAAAQTRPAPALIMLGERFGLSRFEHDVLLLCAAMELDTRTAALCACAQGDPVRPYPTFALALSLFDEPAWDVLSPQRPLRFWRLVEINQPAGERLTGSALRADERIVNYIKGLNYLDDRLLPLLAPFETGDAEAELPPSQQSKADEILERLRLRGSGTPIVQLLGHDTPGKHAVAARVVAELGLTLHRLPVTLLPAAAGELDAFARLWERETILSPIALYLEDVDAEANAPADHAGAPLRRFLVRTTALTFLDAREVTRGLGSGAIAIEIARPTTAEQHEAWRGALGSVGDAAAARLASQFDLDLQSIRHVARSVAQSHGEPRAADLDECLWNACLVRTRPQLDALTQRLEPKATWDSLVLPHDETELLRTICKQVRQRRTVYEEWGFAHRMNRGLGISALFAGESGTGKTMAAEVIANELCLNLYRIDLSAVVSKFIGETEKNLRRLFDAAEAGGAILFFDEADALFGKRSEVKDSHDRYANIEINYLLQRIETYRGLAILATNLKSALDQAFVRRLRFIVSFPHPGVAERRLMWERVFPPETPRAGLDLDRLARLSLTGASIHGIALNAAFLAAEAGTAVTMPLILHAARGEFLKLERPINAADFRYLERAEAIA